MLVGALLSATVCYVSWEMNERNHTDLNRIILVEMQGSDDLWRLRVGDYRVVMQIDLITASIIITVIQVGHRKEVYR